MSAQPKIELTRDAIIDSLARFAAQRPGFEFVNYGSMPAYRCDKRRAERQLHDARTLLAQVRWRTSIGVPELRAAFRAFSGRLTLNDNGSLSYCTGQYFPTEFRAAVCAVLASALWEYMRENMPKPDTAADGWDRTYDGLSAGSWLRRQFRREFGAAMQKRWFD